MGKYINFTPYLIRFKIYEHVNNHMYNFWYKLKNGSLAIKPQRPVLTQNNIISCTQCLIVNNTFMSPIEIFAVYIRMMSFLHINMKGLVTLAV
jgi:hypothetical protein